MALPNLLIVGAAKSGTTSLHNYLNQHPDIFMCSPKEPHFLINKEIGKQRINKGIIDLKDYESLFGEKAHLKYRGESSVMYLSFPEIAIKNIKHYLDDDIKIIIMLRNPVERAYSGYQHVKRYKMMENLSFEDALELGEERYHDIKNFTPASRYLELGNYYNQVNVFRKSFDNIHVVIYDDYKTNFNEEFNGFHFYEIDFTFANHLLGVKVGVIFDIKITHKSIGETNDEWDKNRINFIIKWQGTLPYNIDNNLFFNSKTIKLKTTPKIRLVVETFGNLINCDIFLEKIKYNIVISKTIPMERCIPSII